MKPDGHLIIVEPAFHPFFVMDVVFYVKRLTTMFTSQRIEILGQWHNIGPPVVSYFTNEQLVDMLARVENWRIVATHIVEERIGWLMRCALITRRTVTTLVVRKSRG